jgi:hypothetical protein
MNTIRSTLRRLIAFGTGALLIMPLIAEGTAVSGTTFSNPLGNTTVTDIIKNIILWMLGLAGFIALIALVFGGVRMIIGGLGSESELAQARRTIFWAIIGLVVIALAAVVLATVGNLLGISVTLPAS